MQIKSLGGLRSCPYSSFSPLRSLPCHNTWTLFTFFLCFLSCSSIYPYILLHPRIVKISNGITPKRLIPNPCNLFPKSHWFISQPFHHSRFFLPFIELSPLIISSLLSSPSPAYLQTFSPSPSPSPKITGNPASIILSSLIQIHLAYSLTYSAPTNCNSVAATTPAANVSCTSHTIRKQPSGDQSSGMEPHHGCVVVGGVSDCIGAAR